MLRFILLSLQQGNLGNRYVKAHEGWFFGALAGIGIYLGICLTGLFINVAGGQWLNFILAGLFQLVAFLLIFMPGHWIALTIAGFLLGQPGNSPGLSIEDGKNTAEALLKKMASVAGSIIFYGSIPFIAMGIFSFKGHAFVGIIMLSLAAPVAIAASRIFQKPKFFITLVYWVEVIVLIVALGSTFQETYWTYFANEREQTVRQINQVIEGQAADADQEVLKRILQKAKDGKPLKPNEIEMLKRYRETLENKTPVALSAKTITATKEGIAGAKAEALKTWYGEEHIYPITLSAEKPWVPVSVCGLPIGDYKISVRNTVGAMITKPESSESEGDFSLANSNTDQSKQFGIMVNGKSIGSSIAVTTKDQCLEVSAWFHPNIRRLFENGSLVLSNAPSANLVLTQ